MRVRIYYRFDKLRPFTLCFPTAQFVQSTTTPWKRTNHHTWYSIRRFLDYHRKRSNRSPPFWVCQQLARRTDRKGICVSGETWRMRKVTTTCFRHALHMDFLNIIIILKYSKTCVYVIGYATGRFDSGSNSLDHRVHEHNECRHFVW